MQVLQVLVDRDRFRTLAANDAKLATLEAILEEAATAKPRVDLVVLPAGYLTARSEKTVRTHVRAVARLARKHRVAVILGVDLPKRKDSDDPEARDRRIKDGRIPYWGLMADGTAAPPRRWRQQSIRSRDTKIAPNLSARRRMIQIAGRTVAVMICGEIFNANYRDAMRPMTFDLVVDIGHKSMTTGVVPALENIVNRQGRWAIHTHHVKEGDAQAHAIGPGGANLGVSSVGAWRALVQGGPKVFTTTRTL